MREIKFRAWDYHHSLCKHIMRPWEAINTNCIQYFWDDEGFPDRVIMQYTGLTEGEM